ncbi:hypothetical protein LMB24_03315 [Limosilactobacillus reuteri]|uniref:hypothetical protein n=1 Tax=Limosilactobacillus reuteri TaxID=1598 RepID=UPI001E2B4634|nr:hypothetical protein [Limosilactobacillus reuteri]MCC4379870.1 hypothetical protein [Limosilactobacillus reuteri]MCC4407304.1 hypothetical protein [Limosilactobacillus reuteri]MCC4415477.1 hypothetical protein [Limosilactobacillus reuteri]MCC4429722.1 hypothetical protein [Limosilactobacillus reuteri]
MLEFFQNKVGIDTMNLNSDSTKLIKNWLLKVPLDELRKKINECKNQSDKEWWERIYKIAAQRRK